MVSLLEQTINKVNDLLISLSIFPWKSGETFNYDIYIYIYIYIYIDIDIDIDIDR